MTRLGERRHRLHPRRPPHLPTFSVSPSAKATTSSTAQSRVQWMSRGGGPWVGVGVGCRAGEAPQLQETAPRRLGAAAPPRRARLDFDRPAVALGAMVRRGGRGGGGRSPRARQTPSSGAAARPPQRGVPAVDAAGQARLPHGGRQDKRRRQRHGGRTPFTAVTLGDALPHASTLPRPFSRFCVVARGHLCIVQVGGVPQAPPRLPPRPPAA